MPLKTITDDEPSINMTAMVDVVLQLVLFLLLATKTSDAEQKIGLEVPQVAAASSLTAAPEQQIVNVERDGALSLDDSPVSLDELVARLTHKRTQYRDLRVLVRGDARGQFQRVAEVLGACKQAGIQELGISVLPITPEKQ